ncbi:Bro-N domain-containing protein [Patescibacteria group bacterium]|nr:Bro-N domain-containing protein [Patescibacteria group bacterium]
MSAKSKKTKQVTATKIAIFKGKRVRRTIHKNEWWFSVIDICGAITGSVDPGAYWRKLKQRLKKEGSEVVTFCHELKLEASDSKEYKTDCANTETVFRLIQSIPSPKAEPFKRWLANVGYERIEETEDLKKSTCRDFLQVQREGKLKNRFAFVVC